MRAGKVSEDPLSGAPCLLKDGCAIQNGKPDDIRPLPGAQRPAVGQANSLGGARRDGWHPAWQIASYRAKLHRRHQQAGRNIIRRQNVQPVKPRQFLRRDISRM